MSPHNLVSAQNDAEDMVAPLTINVCITHHAALNAITCSYMSNNSLPATSLGFSVSRKNRTLGGGGWCIHPKGENSMPV